MVILFLVDLFLAVGADGKVLIALTTGRQVLRKMLLSWECSATLPLCTKRAMSRVPGPWEAVLAHGCQCDLDRKGNFVSLFMCVVCVPVHKCVGEHVCVCIYTWRAEADIGTPRYLCVIYTKACFKHLNLELASGAVLASQLAQGSLSPKSWDYNHTCLAFVHS